MIPFETVAGSPRPSLSNTRQRRPVGERIPFDLCEGQQSRRTEEKPREEEEEARTGLY
jgi:hypothetical protein